MKPIKSLLLCAMFGCVSGTAVADSVTLQAGEHDLRAANLVAAPTGPLANTSRDTVSFDMPVQRNHIHHNRQLSVNEPFVAVSREYRTAVSARELNEGVTIRTTGAGAVVALSPLSQAKGAGLSPLDLSIATSEGTVLRGADGMDQLVDQAAIQATGVPFSNGMVGFRLNRALGSGTFVLRADKGALAPSYQLHVLDAKGSAELSLRAPEQALAGQTFEAGGQFVNSGADVELKSVSAFVLSPEGERFKAEVSTRGDAYSVLARAMDATSYDSGLWELHVSALDATGLQRDVKTAFATAYPTARLDGTVEREGFRFDVGVQVASAGRYEVSAVLYGTTESGSVPVATSATAQWVSRGAGVIRLTFNDEHVAGSGASAPFSLRFITLKDQSRLSVLERIAISSDF